MEKDRVFLWGVLSLITGVLWGSFFSVPTGADFFIALALVISIICAFPKRSIVVGGIFCIVWYAMAAQTLTMRREFHALQNIDGLVEGEARILSDPEERDSFRQTVLRFEKCESGVCPEKDILWQAPLSQAFEAGDRISFSCQLERPKKFTESFDYPMFLAKEGIGYVCPHAQKYSVLPADFFGRARAMFYRPKHALEGALSRILSEPEAGLAQGLLLGGDHYLPASLKADFTRIGLTHMIAVSGYNITLIAEGLLILGLYAGLWRRQAVWTALVGIIFFIIMIGLPASAARAGAMALLVFGAFQTGRLTRSLPILLFAAGVMLVFHPLLLRYDLGFQLSFLATLGIVIAEPYQEQLFRGTFFGKSLLQILFMTFVVELFVLPIILFSFHTFSPLIFIGNFLVILVPFAMGGAFLAALLFLLFPGMHVFFAWCTFVLLSLITHSVEWLGERESMTLTFMSFGVKSFVLWYALLFFGVFSLEHFLKKHRYGTQE